MQLKGKLNQVWFDFFKKQTMVTFEFDGDARADLSEMVDELRIDVKKYRKRRSLDANSYFHVLVGKLADAVNSSKPAIKNLLISRYGQYERQEDGKLLTLLIRDDVSVSEREDIHLFPTTNCGMVGNILYRMYIVMRGSHTYNTEEMARLISGTIYECRQADIPDAEIMTPDERERLESVYGINLHSN